MNRSRCPFRSTALQSGGYRHGDSNPGTIPPRNSALGIPLRHPDGTIRAFTMVDPEDFERFGVHRWCVRETHHLYVVRLVRDGGRSQRLYLHREIMGLQPGDPLRVDHINRDTLDNRRSNLRIATDAQNAQNQAGRPGLSKYRGVTWRNDRNRWRAGHWLNHKYHYIGTFEDEDEAGRAAAAWRAEHMPFSKEGTDPAALLTPEDKEAALIRCRLPIPASVLLDDRIHRNEQNWLFWSAWLLEFKAVQESRRAERRKA